MERIAEHRLSLRMWYHIYKKLASKSVQLFESYDPWTPATPKVRCWPLGLGGRSRAKASGILLYFTTCCPTETYHSAIYRRHIELRSNVLHWVTTNPETRWRSSRADLNIYNIPKSTVGPLPTRHERTSSSRRILRLCCRNLTPVRPQRPQIDV